MSDLASVTGFRPRPGDAGTFVRGMTTGGWRGASDELIELRALSEGTNSAGGFLVPTPLSTFLIDLARNKAQVIQAGARTIPMDSDTLKIPAVLSEPVPSWRQENSIIVEGEPTFGALTLNSKSLAVLVKASIEVLEDVPGMARTLEDIITNAFALEIDRTALYGTGVDPQPLGLYNTAGVEKVAAGANGAAPTWDLVVDRVAAVQGRNFDPTAILANGRSLTALAKAKDTAGNYLTPPAILDGIPRLGSAQIRANETQGTSGAVASSVFVGDFTNLAIGVRSEVKMYPLKERYLADAGQVGFVFVARLDVAVLRTGAFSVLTGVI